MTLEQELDRLTGRALELLGEGRRLRPLIESLQASAAGRMAELGRMAGLATTAPVPISSPRSGAAND